MKIAQEFDTLGQVSTAQKRQPDQSPRPGHTYAYGPSRRGAKPKGSGRCLLVFS